MGQFLWLPQLNILKHFKSSIIFPYTESKLGHYNIFNKIFFLTPRIYNNICRFISKYRFKVHIKASWRVWLCNWRRSESWVNQNGKKKFNYLITLHLQLFNNDDNRMENAVNSPNKNKANPSSKMFSISHFLQRLGFL